MQLIKNKQWPFTKKATSTGMQKPDMPSDQDSTSWSLYRSITEISVSRWMDLTVDGYTKALVKSGNPPEHELIKAEGNLRVQYADAIGDHEYRMYCSVIKEISILETTISEIEALIEIMREAYHPVFAKRLNILLNSSLSFNSKSREQINNSLDRAFKRSRGLKIHLDLKKIQLEKLSTKYNGLNTKQPTREYYYGVLISLSNEAGFLITESISVWDFCERIKRANKKASMYLMVNKKY